MQHVVLLVDDEPALLDVCREVIEASGVKVLTAQNGRAALDIISRNRIDLVVTDMRMPELSGLELLERLGKGNVPPAMIVLTGYGTVENSVECMKLGACDYILKPFNVTTFRSKVLEALQRRPALQPRDDNGSKSASAGAARAVQAADIFAGLRDMDALVREIGQQVSQILTPSGIGVCIAQHSNQPGTLKPELMWGVLANGDSALQRWLLGIAGRVLASGRPRLFDERFLRHAAQSGAVLPQSLHRYCSMIAPSLCGESRLGAVMAIRRVEDGPWGDEDLACLGIIASQAAGAMERIRLSRDLEKIGMDMVTSYVYAVEAKDLYTRGHSERVSRYAALLGKEFGLPRQQIELLRIAGMLHDIGKIGIPDRILNKPTGLTDDEYCFMKRHPVVGARILSRLKPLRAVLPLVYHHHERFDGTGYPEGKRGRDIPFLARIISVVDGFEAMTSNRSYHKARGIEQALVILQTGSDSQWDPKVVEAWARVAARGDLAGLTPEDADAADNSDKEPISPLPGPECCRI